MPDIKKVKAQMREKQKGPKEYQKPQKRELMIDSQSLKPQAIVPLLQNSLVAFGVFAFTLIIYMLTQARTMSFWDSGEFATCLSIMGVPHPPGNPFYIVIGRGIVTLFGWLVPHGVLAAFISGLTSALAVMFTYLFTVKLVSMMRVKPFHAIFAGVIAALYTAFSFTFWMNAIEAEVYSGLVFFVNIIIWLTLVWVEKSEDFSHQNILLFIVYLFFVGFGVHQTALQIAPAVLFIICYPLLLKGVFHENFWLKVLGYTVAVFAAYFIGDAIGKRVGIDEIDKWAFALATIIILAYELRDVFDKRYWFWAVVMVILGLSSHIFLMIRAADRPFINEGHPSTISAFKDYVLRKQYGNTSIAIRRAKFFSEQMGYHFLRYFGEQWFPKGLLSPLVNSVSALSKSIAALFITFLGALGAWYQSKRNRHSFLYFLSIFLLTSVIMVFVVNLSNQEVRDRDYFFVCAYNMWAVWLGIGAMALIRSFKIKYLNYVLAALMLLLPIANMLSQYHEHDRSNEFIALDYGVNFLNSLEENAIIFTNGDNDTFPLWYAQAVADPHAREYVYPARNVAPSEEARAAIDSAMEFKNKYLKGIRKDISVANLSLLNTPWYIRQIRDKEGILFSYPDEAIDEMRITRLQSRLEVPGTDAAGSFVFETEPTPSWRPDEPFYRVSDLAVMQIIKDNFGHRPIYFAVTCESYIGFEDYTVNEGMVARLVSHPGDDMLDHERLFNNLDQVYEYRSIGDEKVFKDDNMQRLVMNYGSGFVRAATYLAEQGEYEKATEYIERSRVFIDDELKLTDFYTRFYSDSGAWDSLDEFIDNVVFRRPQGWRIYISYIVAYILENHLEYGAKYVEKGLLSYPNQDYFLQLAMHYATQYDKIPETLDILTRAQSHLNYDVSLYIKELQETIRSKT